MDRPVWNDSVSFDGSWRDSIYIVSSTKRDTLPFPGARRSTLRTFIYQLFEYVSARSNFVRVRSAEQSVYQSLEEEETVVRRCGACGLFFHVSDFKKK